MGIEEKIEAIEAAWLAPLREEAAHITPYRTVPHIPTARPRYPRCARRVRPLVVDGYAVPMGMCWCCATRKAREVVVWQGVTIHLCRMDFEWLLEIEWYIEHGFW